MIDLSADLGEGSPGEDELWPLITSANVACGGHVGDEGSMRAAAALAAYAIGAGPAKYVLVFSPAADADLFALGAFLIWLLPETKGTEL